MAKFLGKPVPTEPIPVLNVTGDENYQKDHWMSQDFWIDAHENLRINLLKTVLKISFVGFCLYKRETIKELANKFIKL